VDAVYVPYRFGNEEKCLLAIVGRPDNYRRNPRITGSAQGWLNVETGFE
jgi:hypothetical protein